MSDAWAEVIAYSPLLVLILYIVIDNVRRDLESARVIKRVRLGKRK